MYNDINADKNKFEELGISYEEKAFYDVLVNVRDTHGFEYADERCIELAKKIKLLVDDVAVYANFINNNNLKSKLATQLTYLIYKEGYPPQWDQEVFQKVLEQVNNYKNHAMPTLHVVKKFEVPEDSDYMMTAEDMGNYE